MEAAPSSSPRSPPALEVVRPHLCGRVKRMYSTSHMEAFAHSQLNYRSSVITSILSYFISCKPDKKVSVSILGAFQYIDATLPNNESHYKDKTVVIIMGIDIMGIPLTENVLILPR